jgi:hypothetical protein
VLILSQKLDSGTACQNKVDPIFIITLYQATPNTSPRKGKVRADTMVQGEAERTVQAGADQGGVCLGQQGGSDRSLTSTQECRFW